MAPRHLLALVVLGFTLALPAQAVAAVDVFHAVAGNPADKLATLEIDDYDYDRAKSCRRKPTSRHPRSPVVDAAERGRQLVGHDALREALEGELQPARRGPRARLAPDAHTARDRREADRMLTLLLAPDKFGNPHALARRMGIQEIIWNCRSWWSGMEAMGRTRSASTRRASAQG